jgi:signal transduction histidine kinase
VTWPLLALLGWAAAAALGVDCMRRRWRLGLVANAAHELRGATAAIGLAAASLRRQPGGVRRALAFEAEIERMRGGLADLDCARHGRRAAASPARVALDRLLRGAAGTWRPAARRHGRPMRLRWHGPPAVVRADRRRLAQAVSNLVANAVEHGSGPVELRGGRVGPNVVIEVTDAGPSSQRAEADRRSDRGRGLMIASLAVEEAGGRLAVDRRPDGTTAAIELPAADP